jgi:hypothetical protein
MYFQKRLGCDLKLLSVDFNHLFGNLVECGQLLYSNPVSSSDSGEFKYDVLCICTFSYVIWNNILGQFDLQ